MAEVVVKHILHSGIFHPLLRNWQSSCTDITVENLMYPIFVLDEPGVKNEVKSMPGIYRYGVNHLKTMLEPLVAKGLRSILLFGIVNPLKKDENATFADNSENPIIQVLPFIQQWFPDLLIACDICLCPYTIHGHCGILNSDGSINNQASIIRIAEVAVAYAKAGAHIVAPSDMMDGRVRAIKEALINAGYSNKTAVLSYSVKFASMFYGPFRDAAAASPKFGDRQCYQLPSGSSGLAIRAAARDVEEGADMLMIKPGLPYLDILRKTKDMHPNHPVFVYQVSGEYAMIYHGARSGAIHLESALKEILISMRRAGADCIITYFTPQILDMLCLKSKY